MQNVPVVMNHAPVPAKQNSPVPSPAAPTPKDEPSASKPVDTQQPLEETKTTLEQWWEMPVYYRLWWGLYATIKELVQLFHYFVILVSLLGFWWTRHYIFQHAGIWVSLIVFTWLMLILWRMSFQVGYVSERHMVLGIIGGCLFVAIGMYELAKRVMTLTPAGLATQWRMVALGIVVFTCIITTPRSLGSLHDDRQAFRHAGLWLAENTGERDYVVDTHCWAAYFAGRPYYEMDAVFTPPENCHTVYIVLEETWRNRVSHLRSAQIARDWAKMGQPVYRHPIHRRDRWIGEVVIYSIDWSKQKSDGFMSFRQD
jgi:hypothetical protein